MPPSLFVVSNNFACRLLNYMSRGQRMLRYCGNRFSRTADPNAVIVKARWIEQVKSLFPLSPSLPCPCRRAETGRVEKWSDIISVSHIPAEGGGEEEENVPKVLRLQHRHPPPPIPWNRHTHIFKYIHYPVICLCMFSSARSRARVCVCYSTRALLPHHVLPVLIHVLLLLSLPPPPPPP